MALVDGTTPLNAANLPQKSGTDTISGVWKFTAKPTVSGVALGLDDGVVTDSANVQVATSGGLKALHLITATAVPVAFATNNASPQLILATSGKLGLGVQAPTRQLEIANLTDAVVRLNRGAAANLDGMELLTGGTTDWHLGRRTTADSDIRLWSNNVGDVLVASRGIGTMTHLFAMALQRTVLTYAASMAIDASKGNIYEVVPTDGVAFTFTAPTNPPPVSGTAQLLAIRIKNTFGALGAVTFTGGAGGFRIGAAWTQPANGFSRFIVFAYDGTNWIEVSRSAADVTN